MDMLTLLMEHDVELVCGSTGRMMVADEFYELGGEFTVYEDREPLPIYRGKDFEDALAVLEGGDVL